MELISSKIAGFQPQMAMGLPEPIRPKLIGTSVRVGRPAFPGGVMVEHEAEGTLLVPKPPSGCAYWCLALRLIGSDRA